MSRAGYSWAAKACDVMTIFRLFRIAFEALRFAMGSALQELHISRFGPNAPERLCLGFARLGTTFIKFGQALSMRQDMLPDEYILALQALQDHIAPFPARAAIQEIERGLKRPVDEILPNSIISPSQLHRSHRFIRLDFMMVEK